MSMSIPIRGIDVYFDVSGDRAIAGCYREDGIQKIRARFEVPTAGSPNVDGLSGECVKNSGSESGIEPDALQVALGKGKAVAVGRSIPHQTYRLRARSCQSGPDEHIAI